MPVSDTEFEIIECHCSTIVEEIRTVMNGPKAEIQPDDVGTATLSVMLRMFVVLHKAGLSGAFPSQDEVKGWAEKYFEIFDNADPSTWGSSEERKEMRSEIDQQFSEMISACSGY